MEQLESIDWGQRPKEKQKRRVCTAIIMVDGKEHKECFNCGEIKPVTEFHDYREFGGKLVSRCKICQRLKCREYYESLRLDGVEEYTERVKNMDKSQRFTSVMSRMKKGKITQSQARSILRKVDF